MAPRKEISAVRHRAANAGSGHSGAAVGTARGPQRLNIMDFCRHYNAATESQRGNIIPVEITISRTVIHRRHQDAADARADQEGRGVEKGSGEPHKTKVGTVTTAQLRDIAQVRWLT